ncbi:SRPBCC family protein [soil metagenome]
MCSQVVAVERVIDADPHAIFELLADPRQHVLLDGSGSVRAVRTGNPTRLTKGARFGMDMRLGVPYRISNLVVEFDQDRRIAWRHFAGHRWRYTLTPVEGGPGEGSSATLVREEWDPSRVPHLWVYYRLMGFPERNRVAMEATLGRLATALAAPNSDA